MPDYTKQELMEIERKKVFSEENIFKRPERYYKLFDMQEKHDFTFASMPADRMMH
jgi:hypothetical protein